MATVSRPGICARPARIASRVNFLKGSDVSRISGLVEAVNDWRRDAVLKYAFTPNLRTPPRGDFDGRVRFRGEKCIAARRFL